MIQAQQFASTRPYLVRALHEWCADNSFTPFVTVVVDRSVQVPMEFVKDGEIVLNIGFEATTGLRMGNDYLEFKARFGGVVRDIFVPIDHVVAIFARENGQGMAFPRPDVLTESTPADAAKPEALALSPLPSRLASVPAEGNAPSPNETAPAKPGGRPTLTRIK